MREKKEQENYLHVKKTEEQQNSLIKVEKQRRNDCILYKTALRFTFRVILINKSLI